MRGHFAPDQNTSDFATMTFSRQSMTGKSRFGISLGLDREAAAKIRRGEVAEIANGLSGSVFVGGTRGVVSSNPENPGVLNSLLGQNCETGHFNAVRGLNKYEHCETAIVVGREQPSAEALEDIARCFAGIDPIQFISTQDENGNYSYVLQCRGHRLRDGSGQPELVEVHPDPLAQSILEQIREAEILQMIDRVRAIFNIRRIIILTSVVLDVTVDWVATWKDLKSRFALERQFPDVIPLRYDHIANYAPSLIGSGTALGSERTAKGFLGRLIKSASSQIDTIWKSALFKLGGQRRASTAIFRSGMSTPQATLEQFLGEPVVSFKVQLGPDVAEFVEPPPITGLAAKTDLSHVIDIGIPFPGDEVQGKPEHPQSPTLISTTPEPNSKPEPASFEEETLAEATPEEIYRWVVAGMDDLDFLDPETASAEAASRWVAEMKMRS